MHYRRLGRTDLDVSVIGLGTWQLGGEWGKDFTQAEADAIVDRAAECGMNLVDTAECYGDHLSEQLVGRAIRSNRDHWVLASKFGHRFTGNGSRRQEWSAAEVVAQLERSLQALDTDRIDLYQFHSGDDTAFDDDELWAALAAQKQAGKIRALGLSVGRHNSAHQVAQATERGIDALQVVYSRIDREPEETLFPSCREQDLGVLAREAMAGGLLSGKYPPGARFTDPNDTRSGRDAEVLEQRLQDVARIKADEVPAALDMAAWSLAWVLRDPAVSTVIPGCKSPEQVEANALAAELL